MKKILLALAVLTGAVTAVFGVQVNNVVASVGKYAITGYDIKKMNDFLQINSGIKKSDINAAFAELIFSYSLIYLSDNEDQIVVRDQEWKNYIDSVTNQQSSGSAQQFYKEYIDQIQLQFKKNQIIRSILSYDQDLKMRISEEIPEKEMRSYYNKNRKSLIEPPYMDAIVLGILQPKTGSLDELEKFDKNLLAVAEALKKTDDAGAVISKYRMQFAFETFSGRTGMKSIYDLMKSGYPTEALGIGLSQNPIQGPKGMVNMKKGTVYGPMPMVLQSTGKATYLIVKLINRQFEKSMNFETAKPYIERKLREDKANNVFKQYVIGKIINNDITVNMLDKKYEGAYNEFVRR